MSEEQPRSGQVVQKRDPASAWILRELQEEGIPDGWIGFWQGGRGATDEPAGDDCDPAEATVAIEDALSEVAAVIERVAAELAKAAGLLVEFEKEIGRPGS